MKPTMMAAASILLLGTTMAQPQPNFIVIQPDDFQFYEEFTPPAHTINGQSYTFPNYSPNPLPNLEYWRTNGLEMRQAYTASAMCGTSRFSTITGRYPSRSSYGRQQQRRRVPQGAPAQITIPRTKLQDATGGGRNFPEPNDCSHNNIAALLQKNGYRTGVTGKWHLKATDQQSFDHAQYEQDVAGCGFDMARGLFAENLNGFWTNNKAFSHNMEYITDYAVKFIQDAAAQSEPFFLYFNPTVPHGSGNVYQALVNYTCLDTPEGASYTTEPVIPGMTQEYGSCQAYRDSVLERAKTAGGERDRNILGSIWLDDAFGALIQALNSTNQLDNTFVLFQLDHGQEGKGSLWESGVRIAQFVHYPNGNFAPQQVFPGVVSTIDIAPTILDYAGIDATTAQPGSWYEMDGTSWKSAVEENNLAGPNTTWFRDERCLFFELDYDRGVRCGCHKLMRLQPGGGGTMDKAFRYFGENTDPQPLMDLCAGSNDGLSVASPANNIEADRLDDSVRHAQLNSLIQAHLDRTHPGLPALDFTELVDPAL